MRYFLLFIGFVLLLNPGYGQGDSSPILEEVVTADSVSATELYSRSKIAYAKVFKWTKEATQVEDAGGKILLAKGVFDVKPMAMSAYKNYFSFTLKVACKDGRYKYNIEDVIFNYQAGSLTKFIQAKYEDDKCQGLSAKQWEKVKGEASVVLNGIINDLKEEMAKSEDW